MATAAEMQAELTALQAAYDKILRGESVSSVRLPDGREVRYANFEGDRQRLQARIAELKMALKSGRRPIYFSA
jgi:hypothetical protein